MDRDTITTEDGEISGDSDSYTPLERPANYSASVAPVQKQVIECESDGELQSTSDSGSDSDTQCYRAKKPKVKIKKPMKPLHASNKRKKYDVWSARVHEDLLSETLNSCDVTLRDRSRNVESYDYTLSHSYYNNESDQNLVRTNNKRNRDDRRNKNIRLTKRNSEEKDDVKGSIRQLMVLKENCTEEELAVDMANKLFEDKQDLIIRIVTVLGQDKARSVYNEVKRIEADGGMLIMNQSRRRTPGGVFLFLLKGDTDLTKDQHDAIFDDEKSKYKSIMKMKKKKKALDMKAKIAASKNSDNLPELLIRAEVVKKFNNDGWSPKESSNEDVVNPPPTPETDGHADSGDNMEGAEPSNSRKSNEYCEDYLDLNAGNDMDMF